MDINSAHTVFNLGFTTLPMLHFFNSSNLLYYSFPYFAQCGITMSTSYQIKYNVGVVFLQKFVINEHVLLP